MNFWSSKISHISITNNPPFNTSLLLIDFKLKLQENKRKIKEKLNLEILYIIKIKPFNKV